MVLEQVKIIGRELLRPSFPPVILFNINTDPLKPVEASGSDVSGVISQLLFLIQIITQAVQDAELCLQDRFSILESSFKVQTRSRFISQLTSESPVSAVWNY